MEDEKNIKNMECMEDEGDMEDTEDIEDTEDEGDMGDTEDEGDMEEPENRKQLIRKKILYVDDVYYSLITIKERLKRKYEVYPAQTVGKMFEILGKIIPDLILLDVNMPEEDGFDAIKKIKNDIRYAGIPIVFLTSQKDKKSIMKGMRLGAEDFIIKPVLTEKLIENIEYHFDPKKQEALKPVILAIDDSPSILRALNSLLSGEYKVYTLPEVNEERVLTELLKRISPDLFLLDYNMPGLNGFDIIAIIRNIPSHEETPVVFLTSEMSVDHVTVAANLGACDYIVKPIDEDILRKKIAAHLKGFIMRRRIQSITEYRGK